MNKASGKVTNHKVTKVKFESYWSQISWHLTRKFHPQVEPLLGSYTNRSHTFWMVEIKPVICTYLCFLQMFSIFKKLKNVKRVCPKRIIKGPKELKGQKRWKYEPQGNKNTMKVSKSKWHYYLLFVQNKWLCAACNLCHNPW